MKIKDYLEKVAYLAPNKAGLELWLVDCEQYLSKFDNSYITMIGSEDNIKYLADLEITEELTHGVGCSSKDNKWYGWSHRAIHGFEIGSTCEKGDCHYIADSPEELIEDHASFFSDISEDCYKEKLAECQILDDRSGIRILHTPITIKTVSEEGNVVDALEGVDGATNVTILNENNYSVVKCGRGEWTAKTLDDAKQMAIDFNEGVS